DQILGEGDAERTVFQLRKTYGDLERVISKPVADSVTVAVDGADLNPGDFTLEAATGAVTLAAAPGAGAVVTAGFQFDVPVRFDADRVDVTLESFEAARVAALPLIEIRI